MDQQPMYNLPRENFAPGAVVFKSGEKGDAAYVIESGKVEVLDDDGARLALLGAGELFGEIALLDKLTRTATIVAIEPTVLLQIDRNHIQSLLERSDPVVRYLITLLLSRFRSRVGSSIIAAENPLLIDDDGVAATRTLMLARDVAHAVDNDQLDLAYQPIIRLSSREVVGFEVLIRWRHPLLGVIVPTNLIGIAEKTGLIHAIGQWVLNRALSDWRVLRRSCDPGCGPLLSINLSAAELVMPTIVDSIRSLLQQHEVDPREVQIELTETLVIDDPESVTAVLEQLDQLGVTVALDDFGAGYAGLDTLHKLPIQCLKIDSGFVLPAGLNERGREIVANAIRLANALDMTTIVEGVETATAERQLREMGCELAQGFYFGHPMPLEEAVLWAAEPPFPKIRPD